MHLIATFLFTALITLSGPHGEPSQACSLHGKVSDATNAESLAGASVHIMELDVVAYASHDGSFALNEIPSGTYTVVVNYVGYEKLVLRNFSIEKAQSFAPLQLFEI
jgi:iron complex outermembrane receptor protein